MYLQPKLLKRRFRAALQVPNSRAMTAGTDFLSVSFEKISKGVDYVSVFRQMLCRKVRAYRINRNRRTSGPIPDC
jgi:hypothetical protein